MSGWLQTSTPLQTSPTSHGLGLLTSAVAMRTRNLHLSYAVMPMHGINAMTCTVAPRYRSAELPGLVVSSLLSMTRCRPDLLCVQVFCYFWAGATIDDKPHLKGENNFSLLLCMGIS